MKALVLHAAGDARVEQRPAPGPPAPDEVTLRVTRVGLCGTDAAEWRSGPVMTPLLEPHPVTGIVGPIVLGHEFIGVVEQRGADVADVDVGQRVAAGGGVSCGACAWCRRGQTQLCASYFTFGLSTDGGLTQLINVPERTVVSIAAGTSDDNAALAQPLAVGLHAARRAGVRQGDTVVVLGCGAIGAFLIAALTAQPDVRVVGVDVNPARLAAAVTLGARHAVLVQDDAVYDAVRELTGGVMADVVIEATGVATNVAVGQRVTRRGGTLLLVGLHKKPVAMDLLDLTLREIDVRTTVAHVCDVDLPAALDLLLRRDLASLLVERIVPLSAVVVDGLEPLASGKPAGKILVDPQL